MRCTAAIKKSLREQQKYIYICIVLPLMAVLFSACGNVNGNYDPSTGAPLPPSPFSQGVTIGSYVVMALLLIVPLFFLRKLMRAQRMQNTAEQQEQAELGSRQYDEPTHEYR